MLKENEVKFYNQNGYLILKDKLDKDTLSDLKNSTIQLVVLSRNFSTNKQSMLKPLAMVLLFLMQRRPTRVKLREVT